MRELLNDEIGVVSGGQPNNEEVVVTRIRRICNPSSTNQTDGSGLRGTLAPESCYASVETNGLTRNSVDVTTTTTVTQPSYPIFPSTITYTVPGVTFTWINTPGSSTTTTTKTEHYSRAKQ